METINSTYDIRLPTSYFLLLFLLRLPYRIAYSHTDRITYRITDRITDRLFFYMQYVHELYRGHGRKPRRYGRVRHDSEQLINRHAYLQESQAQLVGRRAGSLHPLVHVLRTRPQRFGEVGLGVATIVHEFLYIHNVSGLPLNIKNRKIKKN